MLGREDIVDKGSTLSKEREWAFLRNSLVQGGRHTTGSEIKAEKSILSEVRLKILQLIGSRKPPQTYEQGVGLTSEQKDTSGEKNLHKSLGIARGGG